MEHCFLVLEHIFGHQIYNLYCPFGCILYYPAFCTKVLAMINPLL